MVVGVWEQPKLMSCILVQRQAVTSLKSSLPMNTQFSYEDMSKRFCMCAIGCNLAARCSTCIDTWLQQKAARSDMLVPVTQEGKSTTASLLNQCRRRVDEAALPESFGSLLELLPFSVHLRSCFDQLVYHHLVVTQLSHRKKPNSKQVSTQTRITLSLPYWLTRQ